MPSASQRLAEAALLALVCCAAAQPPKTAGYDNAQEAKEEAQKLKNLVRPGGSPAGRRRRRAGPAPPCMPGSASCLRMHAPWRVQDNNGRRSLWAQWKNDFKKQYPDAAKVRGGRRGPRYRAACSRWRA